MMQPRAAQRALKDRSAALPRRVLILDTEFPNLSGFIKLGVR